LTFIPSRIQSSQSTAGYVTDETRQNDTERDY
jgi:hypothetical protein